MRFAEMGRLSRTTGALSAPKELSEEQKRLQEQQLKAAGVEVPAGGGNVYQAKPRLVPACPRIHTAVCNNKGECNPNTGKCMCYAGWAGFDCSLDPLSFYSFDIDCDEMTEEYVSWCLAQTSFGSCKPYQLSWDQLCYRTCEALQGVVCSTWTRRHYCAHDPDCPALCNNFLETYCLPRDPRSEPPYGGSEAGKGKGSEAGAEAGAGAGAEGVQKGRLVQKAGIATTTPYQRKGGTKKGGTKKTQFFGKYSYYYYIFYQPCYQPRSQFIPRISHQIPFRS